MWMAVLTGLTSLISSLVAVLFFINHPRKAESYASSPLNSSDTPDTPSRQDTLGSNTHMSPSETKEDARNKKEDETVGSRSVFEDVDHATSSEMQEAEKAKARVAKFQRDEDLKQGTVVFFGVIYIIIFMQGLIMIFISLLTNSQVNEVCHDSWVAILSTTMAGVLLEWWIGILYCFITWFVWYQKHAIWSFFMRYMYFIHTDPIPDLNVAVRFEVV